VNIALWIVQAFLALLFLMAGGMKTFQYQKAKAGMPWVKESSRGFVAFIGIVEILGAIGLILPDLTGIAAWLTPASAAGLGLIMLFAAIFHARRKENQAIGMNVVLLVLAAFVVYGHWFA
jgi:uncharacterized membrane protein YphA (DoxX/SURF4 family)